MAVHLHADGDVDDGGIEGDSSSGDNGRDDD